MSKQLSSHALLMSIAVATLAACGGGGGSPGTPSPEPVPTANTIDVAAAWHNYLTVPNSWKMPGKEPGGRTFEIGVDTKPGPVAVFSMTGTSGPTLAETLRLAITGANTVSSNNLIYFNNDNIFGIASDNGSCEVPRPLGTPLPHASPAGATGAFFTLDGYAGCTRQGPKLNATIYTWAIEIDSNLMMFCVSAQEQSQAGSIVGTNVHCIEASANGTLGSRAKYSMTMPDGSTLNGRNF